MFYSTSRMGSKESSSLWQEWVILSADIGFVLHIIQQLDEMQPSDVAQGCVAMKSTPGELDERGWSRFNSIALETKDGRNQVN